MVVIPAGRFHMGCLSDGAACVTDEAPIHEVVIAAPFALSVYEVTFEDFDRFSLPMQVDDAAWGRGRLPVINVSWDDAQGYAEWLSMQTGAHYRLPTEAEWEYAARAGTVTKYHWGDEAGVNRANCKGCGSPQDFGQTVPVGSFPTNGFGLHDMHGNVWEWVEDCLNGSYAGAPFDGSAWVKGDCMRRMVRGGSWFNNTRTMRAANRLRLAPHMRLIHVGFRVARALTP
ncbi:MAG: formylglycine-generating enzyme family protein [Gammaproteobacteria bacterium]|nr:formylglycine-generating enzyme family protein [Gammaproteobacteria bacterium]